MKSLLAAVGIACLVSSGLEAGSLTFETGTGSTPAPGSGLELNLITLGGHIIDPTQGLFYLGAQPVDQQLTLELINRARANPGAEALRYGIDLNEGLPPGTIPNEPLPPLAGINSLHGAASYHASWMLTTGTVSHTNSWGDLNQRLVFASYFPAIAWQADEIVSRLAIADDTTLDQATRAMHEKNFRSPEERRKMFDARFDEAGTSTTAAALHALYPPYHYGALHVPEVFTSAIFAYSSSSPDPDVPYVLGVAYQDRNANGFYDAGEGLPNALVKLSPGGATTTTSSEGGYSLPRKRQEGQLAVTFSGSGMQTPVTLGGEAVRGKNLKIDLVLPVVANPAAIIEVTGDLAFGDVAVGTSSYRTITISNKGSGPLTLTEMTHASGRFGSVAYTPIVVGSSQTVTVGFHPDAAATHSGSLTIRSNAANGEVSVPESGRGVVLPFLTKPTISPSGSTFTKSVRVKIDTTERRTTIRYTTDGSAPTENSARYTGPIVVRETVTIQTRAYKPGFAPSPVASARFTKN